MLRGQPPVLAAWQYNPFRRYNHFILFQRPNDLTQIADFAKFHHFPCSMLAYLSMYLVLRADSRRIDHPSQSAAPS